MTQQKMKVKIWSDIMCPFCYIGKRNYEEALSSFPYKDFIETEWQSFQLDPDIPALSGASTSTKEYMITRKGISEEQIDQMLKHVERMGAEAGLDFNLKDSLIANTFDAHRIIQMAKSKGLGDAIEERLFAAYFTEGKDVSNHEVLKSLALEAGLSTEEVRQALTDDQYAYKVNQDKQESQQLGIKGVPFFVLNNHYGISGAQPKEAILKTLEKAFGEWKKDHPTFRMEVAQGPSCNPDGSCD